MVRGREAICPLCCAQTRGSTCEGCSYYAAARENLSSKARKEQGEVHFTARIDPAVDDEVDRALEMLEAGEQQQAREVITRLLQRHPNLHSVQYAMGVVHALQGEHPAAVAHFTRAVEIFPYFAAAWINKAVAHGAMYQFKETVRAYQKVLDCCDPTDSLALSARSALDSVEASVRQNEGISLPEYLRALDAFDAAFVQMSKGHLSTAIAGFRSALMINERSPQSHSNMGLCLAALGRKQEAIEALNRAVELDPTYEPALIGRTFVERLAEGAKLQLAEGVSVNYSSDYQRTGKSLIKELLR